MKKVILLLLVSVSGMLSAQTLEDILKAHDKASGGLEKWQKLKTLKRSGKVKRDGVEILYVEQIINEKTRRIEETSSGVANIAVVNEGSGWKQSGTGKPTVMPAKEVSDGMKQTSLVNELVQYKERGNTVTLVGDDKSDGEFTHKLKLVKKNGEVEYYFLDPKTYLVVKMATKRKYNGQWTDVVVHYSDYKFIGGMKIAQKEVVKDPLGDVLEDNMCEKMDVNLVFNKLLFEMPAK